MASLAEEFKLRFWNFEAIQKEITLFSCHLSVEPDDAPDWLQCDSKWCSRHKQPSLVNFYPQLGKGRFQGIRTFAELVWLRVFG